MGFLGENNLQIYDQQADGWWDPSSYYFKSLQAITPYRLRQIRNWFGELSNTLIVDIGCGGGLISLPLIHEGAKVIAFDISIPSLRAALNQLTSTKISQTDRLHNRKGLFCSADARSIPLPDRCADFVVVADVLDHISDYERVIQEGERILKPGGRMYLNTINRTFLSWLLAIKVAETIRLVPKGTHLHSLFIKPSEIEKIASNLDLSVEQFSGERPAIFKTAKNWAIHFEKSKSLALAYSVLLKKRL